MVSEWQSRACSWEVEKTLTLGQDRIKVDNGQKMSFKTDTGIYYIYLGAAGQARGVPAWRGAEQLEGPPRTLRNRGRVGQ